MLQINEILKIGTKELEKSERAELTKQLYGIYTHPHERILRKKENWKRYIKWLKETKIAHSKEKIIEFKKQKSFIKEMPIKSFCFLLSHIPTQDLYYVKSTCKDRLNRGESASAYLIGSIVIKK